MKKFLSFLTGILVLIFSICQSTNILAANYDNLTWTNNGTYYYLNPFNELDMLHDEIFYTSDLLDMESGEVMSIAFPTSSKYFLISTYDDGILFQEEIDPLTQHLEIEYTGTGVSESLADFTFSISGAGGSYTATNNLDSNITVYTQSDLTPVIDGQTTFLSNVDLEHPLSYFLQYIQVLDETDGDITANLVIQSDGYTGNEAIPGTYNVVLYAEDSAGNSVSATIKITVVDNTAPVISGPTSFNLNYKQVFNGGTTVPAYITASDNVDGDITANITIILDEYTANKTVKGSYEIHYYVEDSSGNSDTHIFTVGVVDNVIPIITGPATISKPTTSFLTVEEIQDQLTASDEYDGDITSRITVLDDDYTGFGSSVGSYEIKFRITDLSGNSTIKTITVNVYDSTAPVIYVVDGYSLVVDPTIPLTEDDIINYLLDANLIDTTDNTDFAFLVNEYTGNEETPGSYAISILARNTNGEQTQIDMTIVVMEDEGFVNTIIPPDFTSWFNNTLATYSVEIITIALVVSILALIILVRIFNSKKYTKSKKRR